MEVVEGNNRNVVVVVVVEGDKRNVVVVVVYSFTILDAVLKKKRLSLGSM